MRIIGERAGLDARYRPPVVEAEELTKDNDGLTLVVAFNYGARQEIIRAVTRIVERWRRAISSADDIAMETVARFLDAPDMPDPDLIIRTSGEQRLSNFLLWQSAYSELVFVPTLLARFRPRGARIRDRANTGNASDGSAGSSPRQDPEPRGCCRPCLE